MKKLLKCYFVCSLVILISCNSPKDPIDQNSSSSEANSQSIIETPIKEYSSLSGYFSLYPGVEGAGMYLYFYPNGNAEIWSCIQTDCNLGKVKYSISNNTVFINTLGKEVSMWVDEDFKIEGDQLIGSKGDNYIFNGEKVPLELTFETNKVLREINQESGSSIPNNNVDDRKPIFTAERIMKPGEYIVNASDEDKVYFYSKPDINFVKAAYFNTAELVYVSKFIDNFGYVEFKNSNGQVSKGWVIAQRLSSNN
jgi:hypothetical protein